MRLADCEIQHRHIRGHNVAFLFGPRAVTEEEGCALLAEFLSVYGCVAAPGYVSPDGWQALLPAPAAQESGESIEAEKPVAAARGKGKKA